MKQKSQLRQQEQQESQAHSETREKGLEFESVDALLRFDAEQQTPSANLAQRVKRSVEIEPQQPWWRRVARRLGWKGREP